MIVRDSGREGGLQTKGRLSAEQLEQRMQHCGALGTVVYDAGRLQALLVRLIVQINGPSSKIWMLPDRSFADLAEMARALVEQLIATGREKRFLLALLEEACLAYAQRDRVVNASWIKDEEDVDKLVRSTDHGHPECEFIAPYSFSEAENLSRRLRTAADRLYRFTQLRRFQSRAVFLPWQMLQRPRSPLR